MAQNLALNAFAQPVAENLASAIQLPDFEAESFHITQTMVSLLSNAGLFAGRSTDDPQMHLRKFIRVCETQKHARVPAEVVRLMLFPFSLTDVASDWFDSLPVNSITSWDDLVIKFMKKFFPPNKTAKMVDEILMFRQNPLETLPEAWERFKGCLRKCPHHGIPDQMLRQRLYMGMNDQIKGNLDAAAGGAFLSKTFAEAKALLDVMAQNSGWLTRDAPTSSGSKVLAAGISHGVEEQISKLQTTLDVALKQFNEILLKPVNKVETTDSGNFIYSDFMGYTEDVNYVNYGQRQQYNQQGHFRPMQQQATLPMQQANDIAEIKTLVQSMMGTHKQLQDQVTSHDTAIKSIETKLGQLSQALHNRPQGALPGDTMVNPKDQNPYQLMAVTLRNGRDLDKEQESAKDALPTRPNVELGDVTAY